MRTAAIVLIMIIAQGVLPAFAQHTGQSAGTTAEERVQEARCLSWEGRYDEALSLLRGVLAEQPDNRDARIHLARVLGWSGRLDEAATEADKVLAGHPADAEALVVKANLLRWRGDARSAVPLYEQALRQGEDFDARFGLAMAFIALGDKEGAALARQGLTARTQDQEKALRELDTALSPAGGYSVELRGSLYSDSDRNRVKRASLTYGFSLAKADVALLAGRTLATDATGAQTARAEDIRLSGAGRFGTVEAGGGLGVTRTGTDESNLAGGHIRAGVRGRRGSAGASLGREVLTDTAALIENRISRAVGTVSLSQRASEGLTFSEEYSRSAYSDGNRSQDIRFEATQAIRPSFPAVAAGYRFRFLDFSRQSGSGYFDPEDFLSNQIFVSLRAEHRGWYVNAEPFAGRQSFTRFGEKRSEPFSGGRAAAGWTMKHRTSFEMNAEGGNYAGGAAAGFRYFSAGFTLKQLF